MERERLREAARKRVKEEREREQRYGGNRRGDRKREAEICEL